MPFSPDILVAPDDYDGIRALLGVTTVDVKDTILNLPPYVPAAEFQLKGLIPDWADVVGDSDKALSIRVATAYLTAALVAESYVKGGTVSLVQKELPRRNWSEWARQMRASYEEWLTLILAEIGTTDDVFDIHGLIKDGPSRHRSTSTWTDLPPVWRFTTS